ncbi:hypothetical protein WH47_10620 [Habropoda laboriosa]|uniref:Uncharacterized protein n=1 Tax=Habropoda laboriosa TaxID=597456 RepID=A0A0L7QLP7_9HYME|nr:hypothetical protein WH47_10620 [Habropoda laboriosa]
MACKGRTNGRRSCVAHLLYLDNLGCQADRGVCECVYVDACVEKRKESVRCVCGKKNEKHRAGRERIGAADIMEHTFEELPDMHLCPGETNGVKFQKCVCHLALAPCFRPINGQEKGLESSFASWVFPDFVPFLPVAVVWRFWFKITKVFGNDNEDRETGVAIDKDRSGESGGNGKFVRPRANLDATCALLRPLEDESKS